MVNGRVAWGINLDLELMAGQKRKRGQPIAEPEEEVIDESQEVEEDEQTEKERRVWEAFREEHFEAIEQLPLTLHRQYTLLEELDRQVAGHTEGLLAAVKAYIATRLKLDSTATDNGIPFNKETQMEDEPTDTGPKGTRALLSQVASLTDGYIRASEEKVNVAEAAYSSVDRQVRMLEQAIREQQQAMIKSGISPDDELLKMTPASWTPPIIKPAPDTAGSPENDAHADEEPSVVVDTKGRKRKGRPKGASTKQDNATEVPAAPRVTLLLNPPAEPVSEEIYCICNRGSFGEMIACDNDGCEREWFHLECLGLEGPPHEDEPFYCPECLPKVQPQKGRPRSAPRRKR